MQNKQPLKEFILLKFKSVSECARHLELSSQAVNHWIAYNPNSAYRYLEFWLEEGYTVEELIKAVRAQNDVNFKRLGLPTFEA